jgi:hypothetical protein
MLVRDVTSGRLVAVPDNRFAPARSADGLGYYGAGPTKVVYDGLGNPVGLPFLAALLPALAPLAKSLLPSLAGKVASLLPGLANKAVALLPSGSDSAAAQSQLARLLPQLQALLQQSTAATPQRLGAPMPFAMYSGMPFGIYAEAPAGTPAPSPGPEAMAPQPAQPPMQPSMQTPMQPVMQTPMEPGVSPPTAAPSSPPLAPSPGGGVPALAPPEEVVVPMRVRRASGETVIVPVRLRRRRRLRHRFVGIQPALLQRPLVPGTGVAQGYGPVQAANVLGGFGLRGWPGY